MIQILGTVFAALLGLAFGSFLNVCLSRWPEGESVVAPRSHCRSCDHVLAWWENIPVLSWILLGGRCRSCRSAISFRYPLIEAAVGILWGLVGWRAFDAFFPLGYAAGMMFLTWLLVALAALDAEHLWLPNVLTLPGIATGILWRLLLDEHVRWALHIHDGGMILLETLGRIALISLCLAGVIVLIRWLYWLIRRQEGIGLGDAKLMALLGVWLGLKGAVLAFGIGVVVGAILAVAALALPRLRRGSATWSASRLPLGTFLCLGGLVSALWGQRLIAAYLAWAGF